MTTTLEHWMLVIIHSAYDELVTIYAQNEKAASIKAGEYITEREVTCETKLIKWGSHFTAFQKSLPQFIQVEGENEAYNNS